jgi:hypothetical protein
VSQEFATYEPDEAEGRLWYMYQRGKKSLYHPYLGPTQKNEDNMLSI